MRGSTYVTKANMGFLSCVRFVSWGLIPGRRDAGVRLRRVWFLGVGWVGDVVLVFAYTSN